MDVMKRIEEIEKELDELKRKAASRDNAEIDLGDMIGRLVMVRDDDDEEWHGPVELVGINGSWFKTTVFDWEQAKLYTGPTRPNWIEWSGGKMPVDEKQAVLIQQDVGSIRYGEAWMFFWESPKIARYTVIEP